MKKLFTPTKFLLLVIIMLSLLLYEYLDMPSQSQENEIIIMLGIDQVEENNILITSRALAPNKTGEKSMAELTLQSQGSNVTEAIDNLSIQIGKKIGLAHCNIIALSDDILERDINEVLDYFTRTKKIGKNAILIGCGESAEEFCRASTYVTSNYSTKVQTIVENNEGKLSAIAGNLEDFYKGYYSDVKSGIIPKLYLSKESKYDGLETTIEVNSSDQSEELPSEKTYFINDGTSIILKDGKKVKEINPQIVTAYNYFNKKNNKNGVLTIENITDKNFTNATLALEILRKKTSINVDFENNIPCFYLNLTLTTLLEEIVYNENKNHSIDKSTEILSDEVISAIKEKISNQINDFLKIIIDNNTDIIEVYSNFYNKKYKKWNEFLSNLENKNDYMSEIKFDININIQEGL